MQHETDVAAVFFSYYQWMVNNFFQYFLMLQMMVFYVAYVFSMLRMLLFDVTLERWESSRWTSGASKPVITLFNIQHKPKRAVEIKSQHKVSNN